MITDALLRLSDGQAVTGTNTTVKATNVVDLGVARDVGEGRELYVVFSVTKDFAGLTSLAFQIVIDSNENMTTAPVVIAATDAIVRADLNADGKYALRIPPDIYGTGKQFLSAKYVIVGTESAGVTAGEVTTDIVLDVQDGLKFYASGFTV